MRVIGGKMRGANLDSPKDRRVRPTQICLLYTSDAADEL